MVVVIVGGGDDELSKLAGCTFGWSERACTYVEPNKPINVCELDIWLLQTLMCNSAISISSTYLCPNCTRCMA